jgi:platelet-activating factor acetylhydrolase
MKRKKKHGFFNPGDEVWMHHKPEAEEIVKWRRRVNGKGDSDSVEEDVRGAGYEHTANDEDEENDEKPDSGDSTDAEPQKTWLGQHPSLCSTDDR